MANPATDRPNHASDRPTWSFHERYASDAEFKRQVDDGRKRANELRTTKQLQNVAEIGRKRKKLY